eukprot:COSAG02_NODE_66242_length_256_cov_0.611465_1_plen_36_part_01
MGTSQAMSIGMLRNWEGPSEPTHDTSKSLLAAHQAR